MTIRARKRARKKARKRASERERERDSTERQKVNKRFPENSWVPKTPAETEEAGERDFTGKTEKEVSGKKTTTGRREQISELRNT